MDDRPAAKAGLLELLARPGLLDRLEHPVRNYELGAEWKVSGIGDAGFAGLGVDSSTGMRVAQDETVMRVAAVYSCVQLLAGTQATLPLVLLKKNPDGTRTPEEDHPLAAVLGRLANLETLACTLRETQMAHTLLRGNSYVRIVRDGAAQVRELLTLQPGFLTLDRPKPTSPIEYRYAEPGLPVERLRFDQVWRVPGLSWNGITGLSPIGLCREVVGLAMALEENTARAMKNGARLAGVLMAPGEVEPVEAANVKGSFDQGYSSVENAGKVALLEAGWKFEKVGMTFEDLQFLELKKFQVAEVARLFRVPLHMLFDDKAQPRANMEQASLEFVVYSLRPWLVRVEQSIYRDLLLPSERGVLYAEHNVMGLLRGDFLSRMQAYAQGRQWGWLSVNKILELENANGIGPKGDIYLQPTNMVPAGEAPPPPAPNPFSPEEEETLEPVLEALRRIETKVGEDRLGALLEAGLRAGVGPPVQILNTPDGASVLPPKFEPQIVVNVPPQPAPIVHVTVPLQPARNVVRTVHRDAKGDIARVEERESGAGT